MKSCSFMCWAFFCHSFCCRHLNLCKQFSCPHKKTHDSIALSMRCYVIFCWFFFSVIEKKNPRHVNDSKKNRFHCCNSRYGHSYVRTGQTGQLCSDYIRCISWFTNQSSAIHSYQFCSNRNSFGDWKKNAMPVASLAYVMHAICDDNEVFFFFFFGFIKWSLSTSCWMNDRF